MNRMALVFVAWCVVVFGAAACSAQGLAVLYDDTHGQKAGNADWVIEGAYSDFAGLLKENGFKVDSLSKVSPNGKITPELLSNYEALILAEPNNPFGKPECEAIVDFVNNGGGAFLIGDHGGADRDNDGWDAVRALNEICPQFGFKFKGDFLYEAPLQGPINKEHPVMFGVRAIGAWAGSTFEAVPDSPVKAVGLLDSRYKKAPFVIASEPGKGRVVALGDSSPFDDGTGSGGLNKLHDSYDSFMYSHPQFAYNAMVWVTGGTPSKRIPSRTVAFFNEADPKEKGTNILVDAAHGNMASDKMETFEKHMKKLGFKVFYTLNLLTPEMLKKFSLFILPDTSLPLIDSEASALTEWFMAGGRMLVACDWDSADLNGRKTLNFLLGKLGSVIRFNDDQVWDQTNKTNKPWGVLAHVLKGDHPAMAGIKTVITWGTCSLIGRDNKPLAADAGVDLLITGDDDSFNKDGNKKQDAVIYPKGSPIPIMAQEKLANGILILIGCCNFTDYQYPDSDINLAKPGPAPFKHETPEMYDNLVKFLLGNPATGTPSDSPSR